MRWATAAAAALAQARTSPPRLQIHGKRRVRSGYPGSHQPPARVMRPPSPKDKRPGTRCVRWRDYCQHQARGFSSYLDLEIQWIASPLRVMDKAGNIDGADVLWYRDEDYAEQRRQLLETSGGTLRAAQAPDADHRPRKPGSTPARMRMRTAGLAAFSTAVLARIALHGRRTRSACKVLPQVTN